MDNQFWYPVIPFAKSLACAALILLVSNQSRVLASDASHALSIQPVIHTLTVTTEHESAKLPIRTHDLILTGTITGTAKQALISVNGRKDEPFTINQVITDGVFLVDVYSRVAVIRRDGVLEKLELRSGAGRQKKDSSNNESNSAPAPRAAPNVIEARVRPEPSETSQKQNNDSQANKLKFMGIPFVPTDLFTQAKIIPVSDGLQITETTPGGMYEHLGLQGGDKILAINGKSVDSPLDVMKFSQKEDGVNKIQATIVRHGNLYSVELDPASGIVFRMIVDPAQTEQ